MGIPRAVFRSIPSCGATLIAFLPAALVGLLVGSLIKAHLFKPVPVALAFIIGGIITWVDRAIERRAESTQAMSALDALKVE